MKTRYKLMRGLCMLVFALLLATTTQAQTNTTTVTACDTYIWPVNGANFSVANDGAGFLAAYDTINGTSYLLELTLIANSSSFLGSEVGTCGSYTAPDGTVYTADTIGATATIQNAAGCDSVITMNITIASSSAYAGSTTLTACNEYTYDGVTYTEDTVITETYLGPWIQTDPITGAVLAQGCDSVVLVDLTITSNMVEDSLGTCDASITRPSTAGLYHDASDGLVKNVGYDANNTDHTSLEDVISSDGIYADTTDNTGANRIARNDYNSTTGCTDWTITHWDIYFHTTSSTEDYHYCESATGTSTGYVWNGITCIDAGVYTYTTINDNGCEHVSTLNFTTGQDSEPTAEEVSGEVSWTDPLGNEYTESGTYTVDIGNEDGCSAFVTYLVTINPDVMGCMDSTNCNYNPLATADDGSCTNVNPPVQQGNVLTEENLMEVNWYTDADGSRWNMNDDASIPQAIFEPTSNCEYYIGWVDANGCETFSNTYSYARMAGNIGEITTYPNPVKDVVSLEFNNYKNQNVKFELLDNNGNKVDEFITPNSKLDIDLRSYPSGVYYISFDSTNNKDEGCITQEKQKTVTKLILNK